MNYFKEIFTEETRQIQAEKGSRKSYQRMEGMIDMTGLSMKEESFILRSNSFYIASHGSSDYPYIQHKGGSYGFLKVLDSTTLGYLEFRGNMQYITGGNLMHNPKVSLFLMDYPTKTRLKILGEARRISPDCDPDLWQKLQLEDYQYKAESAVIIEVKGFDWNCPQHITPRFTLEEMESVIKEKDDLIRELKAQIAVLSKA